jgi:iron complex transport system substrate-binding protein
MCRNRSTSTRNNRAAGARAYHPAMRVVSLVPSASEILCLVGGESMLVGRSHECDHPPSIAGLPVLTGSRLHGLGSSAEIDRSVADATRADACLYHLDADRLRELRPDLILTQSLCGVCSIDLAAVEAAVAGLDPSPRILALDPRSLEGVLDDILTIGEAVGREREALDEVVRLRNRMDEAANHVNPYAEGLRTVALEWTDPPFVAGHWTPQLVERAGGSHPLNPTEPMEGAGAGTAALGALRVAGASIRVEPEAIAASAPEAVVIAPCGLALDRAMSDARELMATDWFPSLPAVERGKVAVVDGNAMFARPGPRLIDAFEFLVGYLNDLPDLIPEGFPWRALDTSQG